MNINRSTIHTIAAAARVCVQSVLKELKQPGSVKRDAGDRIREQLAIRLMNTEPRQGGASGN